MREDGSGGRRKRGTREGGAEGKEAEQYKANRKPWEPLNGRSCSFLLPLHLFLITDNYQRSFDGFHQAFFPMRACFVRIFCPALMHQKASTRAPTTHSYTTPSNFSWLQDASPLRSSGSSMNPQTSHCYPKGEFYFCASGTTSRTIDGGHDVSRCHSSLILYTIGFLPFILVKDCLT